MTKINISTKPNLQRRIFAAFIDYGILAITWAAFIFFFGNKDDENSYSLSGLPAICFILIWFIWTIGVEQMFGVTLGNYLNELQVVSILYEPNLTIGQSFKRHLLDIVDMWPFGILGYLLIKNTKYNQRLGDIWAKTIVVDKNDTQQGRK